MNSADQIRFAWATAAIAVLIAVRLVAAALIDLGADESYYRLWSLHPSWGYYDHPPMVAWWIWLGTAVFGDNPFGVRILFVLSGIPLTLAAYIAGARLFDRATGVLGALWINATLLIGVGSISATPDAPAVLFWTLAIAAFAALVATGRGWLWLLVGLFAGLGVISKLTDLFLGLGLLLCLVALQELRRWLISPWLWAGGLIAALVIAPVALWNAGHDWMTLASQFGRVPPRPFNPLMIADYIGVQFLLLNPPIALFLGLGAAAWIARWDAYPRRAIGILLWTAIPLAAYMLVHSLHSQVQGHWLAPMYPTLALVAAAAAAVVPDSGRQRLRAVVFPLGAGLSLVGFFLVINPGGVLPPWLDPNGANRGWSETAAEIERIRLDTDTTWIATTHYSSNAALHWALRHTGTPTHDIRDRIRYAFAPESSEFLLDSPALLVTTGSADDVAGCFATLEPLGAVDRTNLGGTAVQTFHLYRATDARPDLFAAGC